MKYQLLYIIDNGLAEESKNEIVDKFSALIESLGGTVDAIDKWGTKNSPTKSTARPRDTTFW